MSRIDRIIDDIIRAEGGYSDHASDTGGKTCWGITEAVARANGYHGNMRDLPKQFAREIYSRLYVTKPNFTAILALSEPVAAELVDTGVNMGTATAGKFLQQCLNAFNGQGKHWPDLVVDGGIGKKSVDAFRAYLQHRGNDAVPVMLKALNCLQGARYIALTESRPANEDFVFGWISHRVKL